MNTPLCNLKICWPGREARVLVKMIYEMTSNKTIEKDFRLVGQLRSASVSMMSNIAEGFERHSMKEKIHFYNISRASCAEVRSLLYVVLDSFPQLNGEVIVCAKKLDKVGKLITGLLQATQKRLGERRE